jgi:hypothetical protein
MYFMLFRDRAKLGLKIPGEPCFLVANIPTSIPGGEPLEEQHRELTDSTVSAETLS